ncbi:MAG: hypothetical protein RBR71_04750 [Gudongella sp.]|nr:hypothetical protein [Gudongella sp.]
MKEIGGYFGLDQFIDRPYYKNMIELNTGRNALLYLVKSRKIKKIYIPYYLCDSVVDVLKKHKYDFEYYHIDNEFNPVFEKALEEDEYLYIVNYYGQITNERVLYLKQKHGRVILDNTHSFFQKSTEKIDTIYSCRKFFGVPDGAYLSTDCLLYKELEIDLSKDRMSHILGRYEGLASDYYCDFQENDDLFNIESLKYMSKLTKNILGAIDYQRVIETRDENYFYLESKLKEINRLNLLRSEGAFAYPLYVENGVEIRKRLAGKKIYIPTLWPNVIRDNLEDSIEYNYAANILPLPCDQRYGIKEMEYLVKQLKMLLN